ncbi:unnamed protein product, partial [Rotaria magnacalcarata]
LARRQSGTYNCSFTIIDHNASTTSFMVKQYQTYFPSILDRLNVDLSILDYNYNRLEHFLHLFRTCRMRILPAEKFASNQLYVDAKQFPLLLEFYLQINVDLFYMKTCSYHKAEPRSLTEGLFSANLPECRYTMTPCGNCKLCQPVTDLKYRRQAPIIFNRYEKHRFVSGYESILNCPATCNTKNFIYVLTCLCGDAEYISETKYTLSSRLEGHRSISNHLIRRSLIGERNFRYHKQNEAAIQMFLDSNPHYWRFFPMSIIEVDQNNNNYEMRNISTTMVDVQNYLRNIPKPPFGYKFSKRQIEKQAEFFIMKLINQTINDRIDLFNTTIVAVLPSNTSDLFRQIIHSLFVTHTEAKLNTLCHIFDYSINDTSLHRIWCADLQRRPISSACY